MKPDATDARRLRPEERTAVRSDASGPLRVLGIMSGTSIDRVDYALCDCEDDRILLVRAWSARSPHGLQARLHADRVILAGGGAANPDLAGRIARQLRSWIPGIEVLDSTALGWPRQTVEPAAFALLAYRRLRGLPGNLPSTTGARRPVPLGQVTST